MSITRLGQLACLGVCLALSGCAATPTEPGLAPPPPAPPANIDTSLTSDDPTFGYSPHNPVRVGLGRYISADETARIYLRTLRDSHYWAMSIRSLGQVQPTPGMPPVERYQLQRRDGSTIDLYIDANDDSISPAEAPAPHGLFKALPWEQVQTDDEP